MPDIFRWVSGDVLSALNVLVAYFALVNAALMSWVTWIYRERFSGWMTLKLRDQADAIFQVCFVWLLALLGISRVLVAFDYATHNWRASLSALISTGAWTLSVPALGGILCWLSLVVFGEDSSGFLPMPRYALAWVSLMLSGFLLAIAFFRQL